MRQLLLIMIGILGFVAGFGLEPALADSWAPPSTKTYTSQNGQFRFTVEPAPIGSSLDYFRDEIEALEEGREVERPAPLGLLEKRLPNGEWRPVWAKPLANAVAPVSAIMADDGAYVVTFDNWHSIGRGENVIVIYGAEGVMIRSMALSDVLDEVHIAALPRSVSSTSWNDGTRILADGVTLELDILIPEPDVHPRKGEIVSLQIALEDGSVDAKTGALWERALVSAANVNHLREAAQRKREAFFREPLVAPSNCDRRPWHDYIHEAFLRLTPGNPYSDFTSRTVLFPRDHERYEESVGWLRERLEDAWSEPRNEAFASPCDPDGLIQAVRVIAKDAERNAWTHASFYVAAPESTFNEISLLLKSTGARVIWIDPSRAIPQRPERIPGTPEQEAAIEAENKDFMRLLDGL